MTGRAAVAYRGVLERLPASGSAWLMAALALGNILPHVRGRPLEWVTGEPTKCAVTFTFCLENGAPRDVAADLYLPAGQGRQQPAIVLSLGAAELGDRDPRVVALADMLARSGFVTLVVTGAPGLAGREVDGALDLDAAPAVVAAAFAFLATWTGVDQRRIGLMGVCVGGAACLVAATRPELVDRVRFVFLIGPYVSLRSVLRSIASRTALSAHGEARAWTVSDWALARQRDWLIRLLPAEERARVASALASGEQDAPVACSPRGQAVFELSRGVSAHRAEQLIDALGPEFVSALEAASPANRLGSLRAETLIMHSVGDELIPVEESRQLVRALRGQVRLHYAEFELFEHVDPNRSLPATTLVRELWRLLQHTRVLMRFGC